jgi:hypothetical protein
MGMRQGILCATALLVGCGSESGSSVDAPATAIPGTAAIVFDTDMGPDVDDAGALAILHAMADDGESTLLGVMISTAGADGNHAIGFIDAVNTFYGRPDVPIGLWSGGVFAYAGDGYPATVSGDRATYPHDLDDDVNAVPDAVTLYRRILAEQPERSVTVLCTGMMNNLDVLLQSGPDDASPLTGTELVRTKVALLVQMGGAFPTGIEFNFAAQPAPGTTRRAVEGWPTPIVFSGFEIGETILTGAPLMDLPDDNPVKTAYGIYTMGTFSRPSWDLTAALYAVRGASTYWTLETQGSIRVEDDGHDVWQDAPDLDQSYLVKKVDDATLVDLLNGLLVRPPRSTR